MANPTLTPFPTPPLPEQDEATFNRNAANSLTAQANFVGEANTVVTWMGQQVTDVAANAKKAGDSSTSAIQSMNSAKSYADNAASYRDSAQVASSIAEKSANLPPIQGKGGYALTVKTDETGYVLINTNTSGFQEFSSSGTFSKPAGAKFFYVEVIGAGGSGAVYSFSQSSGGTNTTAYGGNGGDYNFKLIKAESVPDSVSISVGIGGASVTSTSSNGVSGSASSFGDLVKAAGGDGGKAGITGTPSSPLDGEMRGGKFGGSSIKGGGSGGRANTNGQGSSYVNAGASIDAGSGGADGGNGNFPAGGGGAKAAASSSNVTSGAGAGGRVRIWWI